MLAIWSTNSKGFHHIIKYYIVKKKGITIQFHVPLLEYWTLRLVTFYIPHFWKEKKTSTVQKISDCFVLVLMFPPYKTRSYSTINSLTRFRKIFGVKWKNVWKLDATTNRNKILLFNRVLSLQHDDGSVDSPA